ncbi:putative membrane protein [Bacillus mesophilus]|uniref:Uncharacterized protein n=1 Tax=Bacillus mesophilus TaxID=1808955 RepID=A0A6M0QBQ0_9BACI|nr:hypothetical protein [Bacillus mesophilus]MBM7662989.1 putative membrane protein [Bacillus mesophilus]NEY73687.1 hypothetical protein [Bacillus mesophilus]
MDLVHILIILLSLLSSSILLILTYIKKGNKWIALLVGVVVNMLILSSFTMGIFHFHVESRMFGIAHTGSYILILFIPIISLINFYTLEFLKGRRIHTII